MVRSSEDRTLIGGFVYVKVGGMTAKMETHTYKYRGELRLSYMPTIPVLPMPASAEV